MTGSCSSGPTCAYKHDPAKIPICWPYLQNNCPHTSEACALSHDSNPHRTPLCVHFANAGHCTRTNSFALALLCLATEAGIESARGWRGQTCQRRRAVRRCGPVQYRSLAGR
ncbi:hypothetical protein BJV78DRAFT_1184589 [Lactifluus subvellereus]|nr:hypothetical protein BJV78DRAFT_1184589 [Lactifluus subvellereus]